MGFLTMGFGWRKKKHQHGAFEHVKFEHELIHQSRFLTDPTTGRSANERTEGSDGVKA